MSEDNTFGLGDVTGFLGLEAEDLDTFKQTFESTYIRRDNVKDDADLASSITGKRMGSLQTTVNAMFRDAGLELDTNGKKVEEIIKAGFDALSEKHSNRVSQLEDEALKGSDEAHKELMDKFTKLEKRYKEEKEAAVAANLRASQVEEEFKNKMKANTINTLQNQVWSTAKFKSGMSELEKEGFKNVINNSYKFDLDETGNLMVTDIQGNRISNPNVSGTFMDFNDVLRQESIKHKLYPLNDTAGKTTQTHDSFKTLESDEPARPGRKINRAYRKG